MSLYVADERRTPRPTGFPEYDALTGYVTGNYISEWQDKDGTKWRTVTQVINLGKPDRGTPVDPDMIDFEERLDAGGGPLGAAGWAQAVEASKQKRIDRDAAAAEDIEAHLADNGPSTVTQICAALDIDKIRALRVLRAHPDTFVFYAGQFRVWRLHGQEYTPPVIKRITNTMRAIRDHMLAYGPNTCTEIAKELGAHPTTIHNSITEHRNWFCVVKTYPRTGNMPETRVWGLTEEGRVGG